MTEIEEILEECYGLRYMESSEDKIDRVRADNMKNCIKVSAEAIEQYVIKAKIETAKRIKENVDTEPSRIWIMHYIAELQKGLK